MTVARYRCATLPGEDRARRFKVVVYQGVEGFEMHWTTSCSGCFESGECMGLAHHYRYDDKAECYVGSGCNECGYTGKRRMSWWTAFDDCKPQARTSEARS